MNKAAQELAKLSIIARKKKYGGEEGFRKQMQAISKLPRKRKKLSTDAPLAQ